MPEDFSIAPVEVADQRNPIYEGVQLSLAEMQERYSFIPKIMARFPSYAGNAELEQTLLERYHRHRRDHRTALMKNGEVPGWRAVVLRRNRDNFYFAGVRDDGLVFQGWTVAMRGKDIEGMSLPDIAANIGTSVVRETGRDPYDEPFQGENMGAFATAAKNWIDLSPWTKAVSHFAISATEHAANYVTSTLHHGHNPDTKAAGQFYRILEACIRPYQARMAGAMASTLANALDSHIRHQMRSLALYKDDHANWLQGARYDEEGRLQADPVLARNRQQAAKAYPWLAKALIGEFQTGRFGSHKGSALQVAVDQGEELSRALVKKFEVSPAIVKATQGWSWQKMGRDVFMRPHDAFTVLRSIDINHMPKSRREMAELQAVYSAAREYSYVTPQTAEEIMGGVGGRIASVAKDLEGNPASGISDMERYISQKILAPALVQRHAKTGMDRERAAETAYRALYQISGESFFEGMTLRSALQSSAKWHRALPRLEAALTTQNKHDQWSPLTGDVPLHDDAAAVELRSARDLSSEGLRQSHCVSGYTDEVLAGRSVIYSIRSKDNTLSTVEFQPDYNSEGKISFALAQNMGYDNSEPSKEAKKLCSKLRTRLNKLPQEDIQRYMQGLQDVRSTRDVALNSERKMLREVGYDPFDRAMLEKAWEQLSPFLTKHSRKLGLDAWAEKILPKSEEVKPAALSWDVCDR